MVFQTDCNWLGANHYLFQCANIFLVFTYLTPNSTAGLLYLRFILAGAGFCFAFWGYLVLCALDTFIWNLIFAIFNAFHLIYLLVIRYPKKFDFNNEIVYQHLFESVGIKRYQYKALAGISKLRFLQRGDFYAEENKTVASQLSILLTGSLITSRNNFPLNETHVFEFADSPEWNHGSTPPTFMVSLKAGEKGSILLTWDRKELLSVLSKDLLLKHLFESVVGKDLTMKLINQGETFSKLLQDQQATSSNNQSGSTQNKDEMHTLDTSSFLRYRSSTKNENAPSAL